jgi:hypothetical protein
MTKGDQCKNKRNFPNGIINGYSWYPLQGERLFFILFSSSYTGSTREYQNGRIPQSGLHPIISQEQWR